MTNILVELPDNIHNDAKTVASKKGILLKDYIIDCIKEKSEKDYKKIFGGE